MSKYVKMTLLSATIALMSNAYATTTLKLSHNQNKSHPVHKALQFFAERTNELSKGDLKVRVYSDAQLGNQRESLELVQKGALALAKSNAAELEAFTKDYGVYNLPYLFKSKTQYHNVLRSDVGQKILASSEKNGFLGLAYLDAGARSFYADKAIKSPADLVGLKVRVQPSPTAVNMVKALGGNPTPLAYGELYTALQQKVVDAAENNIPSYTLSRHSEVSKIFSADEHTMVPDVLVISSKVWNELSDENKKAISQAAKEATEKMFALWEKSESDEKQKAIAQGVKFENVDKALFKQAVEPMYKELQQKEPEFYKLVEKIQAVE
ncbi:hypothetical protein A4G19_04575 [Pasteurellaceae bacterium Macca]|nr:hypothetical protein [Pasteurellaceae bacterium Macca]